jgi:hypothetical protein
MSWGCGLDNWGELTTFLLLCSDCLKFPQIVNRPRRQRVPARANVAFLPITQLSESEMHTVSPVSFGAGSSTTSC